MRSLLSTVFLVSFPAIAIPATIVVDRAGGGDFAGIQAALDAAASGDTVLVRPGEYVVEEAVSFNRLRDPEDPAAPPPKDLVLVSEKGPAETVIRLSPFCRPRTRFPMAVGVVFENGETGASRIEGFTVTGVDTEWSGAGIFCRGGSNPAIAGCAVRGNRSRYDQVAGITCWDSSPAITGCAVEENVSADDATLGGGISLLDSSPVIADCTIARNSNPHAWAAGIGGRDSSPTILRCSIVENSPSGVFLLEGSAVIRDCTIARNSGGYKGGGVFCGGDTVIERCTIAGNAPVSVAGWEGPIRIASSIIRGPAPPIAIGDDPSASSLTVVRSCIEGGWPGEGNIDADPRFCGWGGAAEVWVDGSRTGPGSGTAADPFRDLRTAVTYSFALAAGSPCIGAGEGGADMGAPAAICPAGLDVAARTVHIAAGRYAVGPLDLLPGVSLEGAGRDATVLEGGIVLRAGERISGLTVTGGREAGVVVEPGEAAEIADCAVTGNAQEGVRCSEGSTARLAGCRIEGNGSEGISGDSGSRIDADHCTVTGNGTEWYGREISLDDTAALDLESSIVWSEREDPIWGTAVQASRSCLSTADVWPGDGNTNLDPLFCGWPSADAYVDGSRAEAGDGSAQRPFPTLAAALAGRRHDLAAGSPCIGTGAGGSNMGASPGTCAAPIPARTVHLAAGTYAADGWTMRGASIDGAGRESTVIAGTVSGLRTGSYLRGVTVTAGASGGVIVPDGESPRLEACAIAGCLNYGFRSDGGAPVLVDCTISGTAGEGGGYGVGIQCTGSAPVLVRCAVRGSTGPGLDLQDTALTMTACTVAENRGGGIRLSGPGSSLLTDCLIADNRGPGVRRLNGLTDLVLDHCTVTGNICACSPAGIVLEPGARATLASSILADNEGGSVGDSGGGLTAVASLVDGDPMFAAWGPLAEAHVDAAAAAAGDGTPERPFRTLREALSGFGLALAAGSPCIGTGEGGTDLGAPAGRCAAAGSRTRTVVLAPGSYPIEGLTLVHGVSLRGAGEDRTAVEGTVFGLRTGASLSALTVTKGAEGGIVIGAGESPAIDGCTVAGNAAMSVYDAYCRLPGSGISCAAGGRPAISRSTIAGNGGGAVTAVGDASPILVDCTVRGNAGGLWIVEGSEVVLDGCRVIGNGSGIDVRSGATIVDCVIAGNRFDGVSTCSDDRPARLVNCTIAGNGTNAISSECDVPPALLNCIVWGNGRGIWAAHGDVVLDGCLIDGDPLFVRAGVFDFGRVRRVPGINSEGTLPDYVVVEPDLRLGPGSPAIDAGIAAGAPVADIEGRRRPCGPGVDIGAYEAGDCGTPARFVRGDANGDGAVDIVDPIFLLCSIFLGDRAPGCLAAGDLDDDGALDAGDAIRGLAYLFLGGDPPRSPFPGCGTEDRADRLPCDSFPGCR